MKERLKHPLQHSTSPQETIEVCLRSSLNLNIKRISDTYSKRVKNYHCVDLSLLSRELELNERHGFIRQFNETFAIQQRIFHAAQKEGSNDGLESRDGQRCWWAFKC